ncbi:MAG TPA: hypothetical protein VIA81_05655 [Acidimicrobiia bacterium]|jgi:hypothetical protein
MGIPEVVAGPLRARLDGSLGPRISSLKVAGLGEMLGSTDFRLEGPQGPVPLLGGHRLWSAPETRNETYLPYTAVRIATSTTSVSAASDDPRLPFEKSLTVTAADDALVVDHLITNRTEKRRTVAAWAITMVPAGGEIVLPTPEPVAVDADLQARLTMVLWEYTDVTDPRLRIRPEGIGLRVEGAKPIKVGVPNRQGWIAYRRAGHLLVKWTSVQVQAADYADLGASVQGFVGHGFGEIETLGPLHGLGPGESISHREVWQVLRTDGDGFEAPNRLPKPGLLA